MKAVRWRLEEAETAAVQCLGGSPAAGCMGGGIDLSGAPALGSDLYRRRRDLYRSRGSSPVSCMGLLAMALAMAATPVRGGSMSTGRSDGSDLHSSTGDTALRRELDALLSSSTRRILQGEY